MRALLVAGLWAVVACEPGPPLSGTDAGTPVPGAACPPACAPMIEGVGQAKPATPPAPAAPGGAQPFCYCTRRPGPHQSFRCPQGADQSAEALIGPGGGTVELMGQQGGVAAKLVIPPGALTTPVRVRLTESSQVPPEQLIDFSPLYLLEPEGLALAKPSELRLPFGNGDGMYGRELGVFQRRTGASTYTRIGDSYANAGFLQAGLRELAPVIAALPADQTPAYCTAR